MRPRALHWGELRSRLLPDSQSGITSRKSGRPRGFRVPFRTGPNLACWLPYICLLLFLLPAECTKASARRMRDSRMQWKRPERQNCPQVLTLRVNPNSLSYPLPSVLRVHVRVRADSGFDRGVGVRGRGRYPLKPSIFMSLLEAKRYPEHTAARSSREYFRLK